MEKAGERTSSEDLRQDALLVAAVDVVRRLSGLVGAIQQAAIFGVSEEELGQTTTPPTDGDVEGRVSFLQEQEVSDLSPFNATFFSYTLYR